MEFREEGKKLVAELDTWGKGYKAVIEKGPRYRFFLKHGEEEITGDLFEGYGVFPVRESEAKEEAEKILSELFSGGDPIFIRERLMHEVARKHSGMKVDEVKILSLRRKGKKVTVTVLVKDEMGEGKERYVIRS